MSSLLRNIVFPIRFDRLCAFCNGLSMATSDFNVRLDLIKKLIRSKIGDHLMILKSARIYHKHWQLESCGDSLVHFVLEGEETGDTLARD
jgi:hypothetical protein